MTLSPCYRATCDAPGCKAAVMLPHAKAAACREQLAALGWLFVAYRVASAGAARVAYVCPDHHGSLPRQSTRAPATALPDDLERLTDAMYRRASASALEERTGLQVAIWLLHEGGVSLREIGEAFGLTTPAVARAYWAYWYTLRGRAERAAGWSEPWAIRLRAAGAIP